MDWLGQASYMETCYEQHRGSIEHLAAFYDSVGVKMMLLKGYGLSKYYPIPNHRPVGDVDIYLGHLWEYADQMVASKLGIEVDNGHHHHSVFTYEGVMVENHYDFINTKDHPSSKEFERVFKQKAEESLWIKDNDIQNLYYPSADFNALFLLKHAALHFASTEMTLRQLLDWFLFVKAEHENTSTSSAQGVDWNALYEFLREQKLNRFANILNAIGVKYLGFPKDIFYEVSTDEVLINRVFADILSPEFEDKEDGSVLSGLWVKPRRFWHNRWKHKLCYKDSLWTAFWKTLYSKLQKPAHFIH